NRIQTELFRDVFRAAKRGKHSPGGLGGDSSDARDGIPIGTLARELRDDKSQNQLEGGIQIYHFLAAIGPEDAAQNEIEIYNTVRTRMSVAFRQETCFAKSPLFFHQAMNK